MKMFKVMKKMGKVLIAGMIFLNILDFPALHATNQHQKINAEVKADAGRRKSSLYIYDQVIIGGKEYTTVSNGNFLLNKSLANKIFYDAYRDARFFYQNASFNKKEVNLINATHIPLLEELGETVNGKFLDSRIPSMNDWWLYDPGGAPSTKAYVNSSNQINAGRTEWYSKGDGTTCTLTSRQLSEGGLIGHVDDPKLTYYTEGEGNSSTTSKYELYLIKNTYAQNQVTNLYSGRTAYLPQNAQYELYLPAGHSSGTGVTMSLSETYVTLPPIEGILCEYSVQNPAYMQILRKVTSSSNSLSIDFTKSFPCPDTYQKPSYAEVRPIIRMKPYTVFSATTEKDRSIGNSLEPYPASGEGPYRLQMKSSTMKIKLDETNTNVKQGNTLEVDFEDVYKNGLITIPYNTAGSSYDEGTAYISAMIDDDHYKKLALSTRNGKGTANLDINNIAKKDNNGNIVPQEITVNLYQEELSDDRHTDYISEPLQITIKIKTGQMIEQAIGDPSETTYGTPITLHFKEVGTNFSSEPITFSLSSTDQAYATITDLGNGEVQVTPKTGSQTINILVDKAGDNVYVDAPQLKIPIKLNKKPITITALSYTKDIGEEEPSYEIRAGDGELINGDTIPPGIKAVTSYTAKDGKLMDFTAGTDITVEEDDSNGVKIFKDKYEIEYVKGKLIVGAGDSWIERLPSPNAEGWNSTDVVVKPSSDAIDKGYTKLSMNGGDLTESITMDKTSKKEDMKFILYKDNGDTTNEIILSDDIRIDKTAPDLTIKTEKLTNSLFSHFLLMLSGEDTFYKDGFLVTITAVDEGSGIKNLVSSNGSGTIVEVGNTKILTFAITEDFKGTISAEAINNAGMSTNESSKQIINEKDNSKIDIRATNIAGHINASDVFEAQLDFDVNANLSGLKSISYSINDGGEQVLKTYTSEDAQNENLTLSDSLTIPLTEIIQNAAVDSDTLKITIKVMTNSGNILSKDINVYYDVVASEISMISVVNENEWAASKRVDFSVNEKGSGIQSVTVTKPDGTDAEVDGELTGFTFNFTAREVGTYSILVIDNAGNESLKINKNITKIDTDIPVIKDISITPDNTEWSNKKTVTLHATDILHPDSGSGVNADSIKVSADKADAPEITCEGNDDDLTCTFEAVNEGIYTIETKDHAGNQAVDEVVKIEKIDTIDLEITDIHNDGSEDTDTWENKERIVTFKVSVGASGLKGLPEVNLNGHLLTVSLNDDGSYCFTANENGAYTILVESVAGQKKENKGTISKLDTEGPLIMDLKKEQSTDPIHADDRVTVSFKADDRPESGASGIADVTYKLKDTDTEVVLTPVDDIYSFMTSQEGTYTITVMDNAGNSSTETFDIILPEITKNAKNMIIYEGEPIAITLEASMNDKTYAERSYEWFYIDAEGNAASIKRDTLPETEKEQTIPFPYEKAEGHHSGYYRCLVKNGEGYYNWSAIFELTVITDPVTGLIMIPSEITMKKSLDGQKAVADFEIGLEDGFTGAAIPKESFHIQTSSAIQLKNSDTNDVYNASIQKDSNDGFVNYEGGDLAELSYAEPRIQKVRLTMPIGCYHDPGNYQGLLHFMIHYGEGGITE